MNKSAVHGFLFNATVAERKTVATGISKNNSHTADGKNAAISADATTAAAVITGKSIFLKVSLFSLFT